MTSGAVFDRPRDGRDLLEVSYLNGAAFPCRQNLLHALAKKTVPLGDLLAVPSEEEIQLDRLALYIGPVMLGEGRYL